MTQYVIRMFGPAGNYKGVTYKNADSQKMAVDKVPNWELEGVDKVKVVASSNEKTITI